ncbi:PH domain-containing protein [Amycolatopsis sp. GM8]|uniref:PH domain-containing protein n=1 Tax=Amycolatopsis sp. GM8 TaxID=2896530 RepID=UPI001F408A33|nr:PH domain-containing protein [Amycolatopsis sp. GM8]
MHVLVGTPGTGEIITVVYRNGERIFSIAALVFCVLIALAGIAPDDAVTDNIGALVGVILVTTPAIWLIIAVMQAKVVVRKDGIYVRNWFFSWWVTWSAIAELDVDDDLVVVLNNGHHIHPSVGGGSIASALRANRKQRDLHDRIDGARASADSALEPIAEQQRRFGIWRLIALYAFFYGMAGLMRL